MRGTKLRSLIHLPVVVFCKAKEQIYCMEFVCMCTLQLRTVFGRTPSLTPLTHDLTSILHTTGTRRDIFSKL